ncbi:hypothetical protein [Parabacteroides sp. ZJ-118]|uniref:hypothetical protein n=1 Tax=Parabacteroides sp. ZJ-118 TaxID=2709398 RepID=UPI0013EA3B65|nr:hypothetical protein [Parabacteroides sp. ZJ-118]
MNEMNFKLADPISHSHSLHSTFVLTVMSALSISMGTYEATAASSAPECVVEQSGSSFHDYSLKVGLAAELSDDFVSKTRMLQRLESLYSNLQYDNWDGYGASPLEKQAYENTKRVIDSLSGLELKCWNLFPSPNGTLLLSIKNGDVASLSIGNNDFSYAALKGESKMMGQESFEANRVVKVIENIHLLLDYNG